MWQTVASQRVTVHGYVAIGSKDLLWRCNHCLWIPNAYLSPVCVFQNGLMSGLMQILLLKVSAHITEQLGMAPGGEFREAFKEVKHTTRAMRCLFSFRFVFTFFFSLLFSCFFFFVSPRPDGCRFVNFTWVTDRFLWRSRGPSLLSACGKKLAWLGGCAFCPTQSGVVLYAYIK